MLPLGATWRLLTFAQSARNNQGVTEAFMALAKEVKDRLAAN
jgi:hypothetical protein